MSKVKIQGNASGTGVLTVTAPNTSTDRTITLPDSTGTLLTADGDGSSLTGVGVDGISSSADATAITIDSSEQVGIGETTPDRTLHIQGTAKIRNASTSYLDMYCSGGGNRDWQVGVNGANFVINDVTSGTSEKLRIQSGGGISFNGDTAAANALDDYEEGTCTIQYSDGTNVEGNANNAVYTKVGRMVTVSGDINSSGVGSNLTQTAELKLTGFPFTFLKNGTFAFLTRNFDYLADSTAVGYHPTNQTYASLYSFTDHGTYRNSIVSDLHGSTNDMYFTVTYQAS